MYHTSATRQRGSLVKIKPKFQVTIPYAVREQVQLGVGDIVEVQAQHSLILIKPKVLKDRASKKQIEAAIAEGLKDFDEGRVVGPFTSVQELKRSLKK